jgi:mono/diheme cytochrome c family protein
VARIATAAGVILCWACVATSVAAGRGSAARQTQSVWDGVYTQAQAQRGEPLYGAACAECHGSDLTGIEVAPGLAGGEFVWNWNGLTVGDLFERVRISMPQADPNSISRQEKADILAYMLQVSGFPAGETEMASRTNQLRGVSFLAVEP